MRCPFCGHIDQRVLDSRPALEGDAIRRRRECARCGRRFTTFERAERPRLFVVKRDGTREEFSRDKVLNSMLIACRKRRVPIEDLRDAVEHLERDLFQDADEEVTTHCVGEKVLEKLLAIDPVAYVRFASVYREFETIEDFKHIVESVATDDEKPALLR